MIRKTHLITLTAILALLFTGMQSCKDDDNKPEPGNPVEEDIKLTVLEPLEGKSYPFNDTVWISAFIESKYTLHEYSLYINNETANSLAFMVHGHIHTEDHLHIDTFWVNNVNDHSDMKMIFSATDHMGTVASDTTHFHCHPHM